MVEVPVPIGTPLAGFGARIQGSTGVHDPTSVRALVVGEVGVIAIDVCVLHEETCHLIERRAQDQLGLSAVVVHATHTHSGPCVGQGRVGRHDSAVHEAAMRASMTALQQAASERRPVTVEWAQARNIDVARDRRHLDDPIDPSATLLVLEADGGTAAVVASFPCHPVVLDAANTLVTGDYPHFVRARLEREFGAPALFLTGCAGDVNTGHRPEASYLPGQDPARTFARASEIGDRIADALLSASRKPVEIHEVAWASTPVSLAFADVNESIVSAQRSEWIAQRAFAEPGRTALLDIWIDWADHWAPARPDACWRGRVSCLRLGKLRIVFLPGEPFLAAAEQIAYGQETPLVVVGYSDGVPGYLPMLGDIPDGGYEVEDAHRYYDMVAPFAPGSGERLVAAARRLLEC